MQNYSISNWSEYIKNLNQFPGNKKANPFKATDPNNPQKDLRSTTNYFTRAASIWHGNNPTYVTPKFKQQVQATNANTYNAQYDQAKKQADAQFAQNGLYGQGAHQAAAANMNAKRAKDLAENATKVDNQLAATEFQNWNDWVAKRFAMQNQLDNLAIQKQQLDLQRAQIASQNKAMQQQQSGFDWGGLMDAGFGALGTLAAFI